MNHKIIRESLNLFDSILLFGHFTRCDKHKCIIWPKQNSIKSLLCHFRSDPLKISQPINKIEIKIIHCISLTINICFVTIKVLKTFYDFYKCKIDFINACLILLSAYL